MLQPIKPTQSTTATKATTPTEPVRPISEQRPGQTLKDRLYKLPEIQGAKPASQAEAKKPGSIYQAYSIAKTLPATPLAAAQTTAAPGTFASFANKFSSYDEFWKGLSAYQKPESQKEYIHDAYGGAFISPELMPYANKYGLSKGAQFLQDLYRADRLADARKNNPYYQPIMLRDINEYFEDELVKFSPHTSTPSGGAVASNREWVLNKGEIDTLRKIAEDNMLGQSGFEELLNRSYQQKKLSYFDKYVKIASEALGDSDSSSWGEIEKKLGFTNEVRLSDLQGVGSLVSEISSSQGKGAATKLQGDFMRDLLQMGAKKALANVGSGQTLVNAAASFLKGAMSGGHQKDVLDFKIRMVHPSGRLKSKYEDFTQEERRAIADFLDYSKASGIKLEFNDVVSGLAAMTAGSLYKKAEKVVANMDETSAGQLGDRALSFGDGKIQLSKTYNPYGGKNV